MEPVQHSALMTWCVVCIMNEMADDVPSISLIEDWVGPVPGALGLCRSSGTCCSLYVSEHSGTYSVPPAMAPVGPVLPNTAGVHRGTHGWVAHCRALLMTKDGE